MKNGEAGKKKKTNKGIWDEEGRELFRIELGRVEMIEEKMQEIWGEFGTRVRENGKNRER